MPLMSYFSAGIKLCMVDMEGPSPAAESTLGFHFCYFDGIYSVINLENSE